MELRDEDRLCVVQEEARGPRAADHLLAGLDAPVMAGSTRHDALARRAPVTCSMQGSASRALHRGSWLGPLTRGTLSLEIYGQRLRPHRRRREAWRAGVAMWSRPPMPALAPTVPRASKIERQLTQARLRAPAHLRGCGGQPTGVAVGAANARRAGTLSRVRTITAANPATSSSRSLARSPSRSVTRSRIDYHRRSRGAYATRSTATRSPSVSTTTSGRSTPNSWPSSRASRRRPTASGMRR